MNKATAEKIKAALMKLRPNSPEAEKIAWPAKITGFAPISDRDYDMLRQAARLAGEM